MPIYRRTIKYYTCKFRCGTKAREFNCIENHEKKCFCNPETKYCRLCKHFIVDSDCVFCEVFKLEMVNLEKHKVYDQKGVLVWNGKDEAIKGRDIFYVPKERPFPKSNCLQFELNKKAY
jgi:hypothetical protein